MRMARNWSIPQVSQLHFNSSHQYLNINYAISSKVLWDGLLLDICHTWIRQILTIQWITTWANLVKSFECSGDLGMRSWWQITTSSRNSTATLIIPFGLVCTFSPNIARVIMVTSHCQSYITTALIICNDLLTIRIDGFNRPLVDGSASLRLEATQRPWSRQIKHRKPYSSRNRKVLRCFEKY